LARRAARRDGARARARERGATASRAMPSFAVCGGAREVGSFVFCVWRWACATRDGAAPRCFLRQRGSDVS